MDAVDELSHEAFLRGARLFDRGAFFEAHEAWEERWRTETDTSSRRFFQAFIQVAAAFHKLIVMRAPASALRLLARGLAKLDACPNVSAFGIVGFCAALRVCEQAIAQGTFDPSMIPTLGRHGVTVLP